MHEKMKGRMKREKKMEGGKMEGFMERKRQMG